MKQVWKNVIALLLILTILMPIFLFRSDSVRAAVWISDITIPSVVLEGSYTAYSNEHVINLASIIITPTAGKVITKVVIRHQVTKEELPYQVQKGSGNTYIIPQITGSELNIQHKFTTSNGYFAWFRDPTQKEVWMYDLNNERNYFLYNGVYERPQDGNVKHLSKSIGSSFPTAQEWASSLSKPGNIAWAQRNVDLPQFIPYNNLMLPVSKIKDFDPDYEYLYGGSGFVPGSDILDKKTILKDLPNRKLTFQFQARYAAAPAQIENTSSGLVVRYNNIWNIIMKAKLYQYDQMEIVYYEGSTNTPTPSPTTSPSPSPTPIPKPSGDFDISPPVINYRDPVKLIPKNINIPPGCTYQSHVFKLQKQSTWTSPAQTSPNQQLSLSYPDQYPSPISVGSVTVSMQITASCGRSDWVTKSLQVQGPSQNSPPYFRLGWYNNGDWSSITPLSTVVQGSTLMVRPVQDSNSKPPSPSDPDGDTFSLTGWDYERGGHFVRSLPATYNFHPKSDYLPGIVMDTLGYHTIYATMTDEFGASYTAGATVEVIPLNPIPVAACPPKVKANRPIDPNLFKATESYSPVGRQIDHSRNEWTNKRTSYTNGTTQNITATVSLHVWDKGSPALKSITPGTCTITVEPDLPPIAKLAVPPLAIRNQPLELYNQSHSPDGDPIKSAEYMFKFDQNNNGFQDELWHSLSGDLTKASFTPNRVGKYLFYLKVTEEFGQWGDTSSTDPIQLTMDVVNLAPTVSFKVEGENEQPVSTPPTSYQVDTIRNTWDLFVSGTNTLSAANYWTVTNNTLRAGKGRGTESQHAERLYYEKYNTTNQYIQSYTNNGFGTNALSPYRSIKEINSDSFTSPLLIYDGPISDNKWKPFSYSTYSYSELYKEMKIGTTDNRVYFLGNGRLYGLNKNKFHKASYTENWIPPNILNGFTWFWPDGSPYDYVLENTNSRFWYYSDGSSGYGTPYAIDYAIGEKTLYVVYEFRYSGTYGSTVIVSDRQEVVTYDLETGQKIASTWEKGTQAIPNYHGDRLIHGDELRFLTTTNGYTLNRNGDISLIGALPTMAVPVPYQKSYSGDIYQMYCRNVYSNLQPGLNGDYYRYVAQVCETSKYMDDAYRLDDYKGVWVEQMKSDLSLGWRVRLSGDYYTYGKYNLGHMRTFERTLEVGLYGPYMIDNPIVGEIIVRSMHESPYEHFEYQAINVRTGAIRPFPYTFSPSGAQFSIGWDGSYMPNPTDDTGKIKTLDMKQRSVDGGIIDPVTNEVKNQAGVTLLPAFRPTSTSLTKGGGNLNITSNAFFGTGWSTTNPQKFGMLVGDGLWASFWNTISSHTMGGSIANDFHIQITKGTPTDNPLPYSPTLLGQFVSPTAAPDHVEISYTLSMDRPAADQQLTGMSFRMSNPLNRYSLETNGTTLFLSKYVNGARTILQQIPYPFNNGTSYSFKVTVAGNQIEASVNGVPYFNVTDNQFASGKFGPFSNKPSVSFSAISTKRVISPAIEWLSGYALWENGSGSADVRYSEKSFVDPENDPMAGAYEWSFLHTPKFLNHQGVSALNGQIFYSEQTLFDKVGEYEVTLKARDDPHPDYRYPSSLFDAYRKSSNPFKQKLIVHRRPVAEFTTTINGDGSLSWNDTSYDPDRWLSPINFSQPDSAGMNYQLTRGIMERKYYYIAPSGTYVESRLTRPAEVGTYEIGLQVRDEYGAWSYPATRLVHTDVIAPPRTPPRVTLTYPSGSSSSPTLADGTNPTITWQQVHDTPGTVFKGYNVRITDAIGAPAASSGPMPQNTLSTTASWTVPTGVPLERGRAYQVQVQVDDGEMLSDWSNIGWIIINSKPRAAITYPSGSSDKPSLLSSVRRTMIHWSQSDPEWARFERYELEVRREDGSLVWADQGNQATSALTNQRMPPVDLPTGEKLQVRIRVTDHDPNMWSDWSNPMWMKLNYPPEAAITSPSGTYTLPAVVGPSPLIQWRQKDPDPNTIYQAYRIQIISENGGTLYLDTGILGQQTSLESGSYQVQSGVLPQGRKLQIRLMVWDQDGAYSPWATSWIYTNRPPVVDFDWEPKPLWEGDHVRLFSLSTDPDGDSLTYNWRIIAPDGGVMEGAGAEWTGRWLLPGAYQVKLEASDGYVVSEVLKQVQVQPLILIPNIRHVEQWLHYHQKAGHQTLDHPKEFYSGEQLLVEARSSAAPVTEVEAWIVATGQDGEEIEVRSLLASELGKISLWNGSLHHKRWMTLEGRLPEGGYQVNFRILYRNGVEKRAQLPIRIIGSIQETVGVHRVR